MTFVDAGIFTDSRDVAFSVILNNMRVGIDVGEPKFMFLVVLDTLKQPFV